MLRNKRLEKRVVAFLIGSLCLSGGVVWAADNPYKGNPQNVTSQDSLTYSYASDAAAQLYSSASGAYTITSDQGITLNNSKWNVYLYDSDTNPASLTLTANGADGVVLDTAANNTYVGRNRELVVNATAGSITNKTNFSIQGNSADNGGSVTFDAAQNINQDAGLTANNYGKVSFTAGGANTVTSYLYALNNGNITLKAGTTNEIRNSIYANTASAGTVALEAGEGNHIADSIWANNAASAAVVNLTTQGTNAIDGVVSTSGTSQVKLSAGDSNVIQNAGRQDNTILAQGTSKVELVDAKTNSVAGNIYSDGSIVNLTATNDNVVTGSLSALNNGQVNLEAIMQNHVIGNLGANYLNPTTLASLPGFINLTTQGTNAVDGSISTFGGSQVTLDGNTNNVGSYISSQGLDDANAKVELNATSENIVTAFLQATDNGFIHLSAGESNVVKNNGNTGISILAQTSGKVELVDAKTNSVTGKIWADAGTINLSASEKNQVSVDVVSRTNATVALDAGQANEVGGNLYADGNGILTSTAEVNTIGGYVRTLGNGQINVSGNSNTVGMYLESDGDYAVAGSDIAKVEINATDSNIISNTTLADQAVYARHGGQLDLIATNSNTINGNVTSIDDGSALFIDGKTNTILYSVAENLYTTKDAVRSVYVDKNALLDISGETNNISLYAAPSTVTNEGNTSALATVEAVTIDKSTATITAQKDNYISVNAGAFFNTPSYLDDPLGTWSNGGGLASIQVKGTLRSDIINSDGSITASNLQSSTLELTAENGNNYISIVDASTANAADTTPGRSLFASAVVSVDGYGLATITGNNNYMTYGWNDASGTEDSFYDNLAYNIPIVSSSDGGGMTINATTGNNEVLVGANNGYLTFGVAASTPGVYTETWLNMTADNGVNRVIIKPVYTDDVIENASSAINHIGAALASGGAAITSTQGTVTPVTLTMTAKSNEFYVESQLGSILTGVEGTHANANANITSTSGDNTIQIINKGSADNAMTDGLITQDGGHITLKSAHDNVISASYVPSSGSDIIGVARGISSEGYYSGDTTNVTNPVSTIDVTADNSNYVYGTTQAVYAINRGVVNISATNGKSVFASDLVSGATIQAYSQSGITNEATAELPTTININGVMNITNTGATTSADGITTGAAVWSYGNHSSSLGGNDTTLINLKYACDSTIRGSVVAGQMGTVNVTPEDGTSGTLTLSGDAVADTDGIVNLSLTDGSTWVGVGDDKREYAAYTTLTSAATADTSSTASAARLFRSLLVVQDVVNPYGTVNVNMDGSSDWWMPVQSSITTLSGNGGTVHFNGNGVGRALNIGTLTGSHTFAMNLRNEANAAASDMLYIKNGTTDQQTLVINNAAQLVNEMTLGDSGAVRFATITNSGNEFRDGSTVTKAARGAYNVALKVQYRPVATDVLNTSTYNDAYNGSSYDPLTKPGTALVESMYGGENAQNVYVVLDKTDTPSDYANTTVISTNALRRLATNLDTFTKRNGQIQYMDSVAQEGAWVRLTHSKDSFDAVDDFSGNFYEFGYKSLRHNEPTKKHTQSVAVSYGKETGTYTNYNGNMAVRNLHLALYDTMEYRPNPDSIKDLPAWQQNTFRYKDAYLKIHHLRNEMTVYDSSEGSTYGQKNTANYNQNVINLSGEYGARKPINENWYWVPQAQLQGSYLGSINYTDSLGADGHSDSAWSLIGRVGFDLVKELDAKAQSKFYVKANLYHEFLNGPDVRYGIAADGPDMYYTGRGEGRGTWFNLGAGFSKRVSDGRYVFADFERNFGHGYKNAYSVRGGISWTY